MSYDVGLRDGREGRERQEVHHLMQTSYDEGYARGLEADLTEPTAAEEEGDGGADETEKEGDDDGGSGD